MTNKNIQALIDKYLEGETTLEEEKVLARELLHKNLHPEWQAVRLMLGELAMGEAEYDEILSKRQRPVRVASMKWRWIAAAACLMIMICIGTTMKLLRHQPVSKPMLAVHDVQPSEQPLPSSPKEERKENLQSHRPSYSAGATTEKKEVKTSYAANNVTESTERETSRITCATTENEAGELFYAVDTATEDTVDGPSPSRMDEFIAKLASYNHAEGLPLKCSTDEDADSTIVSMAYVFDDNEETDVMSRLLQAACSYDSKTPGYLLNFSHKQFVFCLEDLHKEQKYLWIAERISGQRILLFATHSPISVTLSTVCYQNFRDQQTHTGKDFQPL